ncbi:unnamed protein product [Adineta steineri]|uniref:G-protein coupled receptors family 1 profile domain-containing protein n=1 Tax=Adineta steineri TaxID=433720 RepID=A0A814MNU1_9BILA|nr:unnamed protein product [Adineta steineri]CAF1081527.1 unnamed protein product [Adineta steineri]
MSLSSLAVIQQAMTRYVLPITLGLGNVGNIILIVFFSQKNHRMNSCSLYLLVAAFFGIVGGNCGVIPYVVALYFPDPFNKFLVLCRLRLYIIYISAMSFRSMIVLATVDRFALSSSRQSFRALNSFIIAQRATICICFIWAIAGFHLLIWPTIQNDRCLVYGVYGFTYSILQLITLGLLPTILMIIFGTLLKKNLYQTRARVHHVARQAINLNTTAFRKRDRFLIVLVYTEIFLTFIFTFPYASYAIYTALTNNIPNKSVERLQIESFAFFFTVSFLLYLGNSTTFYGYMAISKTFRREVKTMLLRFVGRRPTIIGHEPAENNMPTRLINQTRPIISNIPH